MSGADQPFGQSVDILVLHDGNDKLHFPFLRSATPTPTPRISGKDGLSLADGGCGIGYSRRLFSGPIWSRPRSIRATETETTWLNASCASSATSRSGRSPLTQFSTAHSSGATSNVSSTSYGW